MTTAVAPSKARNWEAVFPENKGYAEKGEHWSTINTILYNVALAARFGFKDMPHEFKQDIWNDEIESCSRCDKPKNAHPIELSLTEQVLLTYFRTWAENKKIVGVNFATTEWNDVAKDLGEMMLFMLHVANSEPTVGHFVGRGFEQNENDADAFLRNT